jgi:hypothetical protein
MKLNDIKDLKKALKGMPSNKMIETISKYQKLLKNIEEIHDIVTPMKID